MTDVTISQPSRQAIAGKTASKPGRVTGKLQVACKAIAWEGQELDQAAKTAGLTTRALRLALERRHVIAFLKEQREVFRAYVSAQNIHHAKELRDKTGNAMAKLGAMKYIDQIADAEHGVSGRSSSPGVTIIIGQAPSVTAQQHRIEANPLTIQGSCSPSEPADED
jgi:hypothetical protein